MHRILNFNGQDVKRTATVASIIAQKSAGGHLCQVTASTAAEAYAAEQAGIDMVVCMAQSVREVREGSAALFTTAAIDFSGAVSEDELLGVAFKALSDGADAVITTRRMQTVHRLAEEHIPVMGHLGFIPKKATHYGGVRAVGKTSAEAALLWEDFKRLEDAGAFAVECELIPAAVMQEINKRTGLVTISLGSGQHSDVIFLFTSDICGESPRVPRHARSYANLAKLQSEIDAERVRALRAFQDDVAAARYPSAGEIAEIDPDELARFVTHIDARDGRSD